MTNLNDKPFALIGVNVNGYDAGELKDVMDKEHLTWRSFADPGDLGRGAIAVQWNFSTTPMLYVIDHRGVIRHKWLGIPGEQVIDAVLHKLIKEAEGDGKPTRE